MSDETAKLIDRAMTLSFEQAYAEADKLKNRTEVETAGIKVYSGVHPQYGCIHISIPLVGESVLLKPFDSDLKPFAIQSF